MIKRLIMLLVVAAVGLGILTLFSSDTIKIDWVSFMEIQPSYKAMEDPLAVPAYSIPAEGAAFIPGMDAPVNPVPADDVSLARGEEFFRINCVLCHGLYGTGNGVIGTFFKFKPADLTSLDVQSNSDGSLFMTISTGVNGRMPALNENFAVRDRWDLVNFLRTLKR